MWRVAVLVAACGGDEGGKADAALSADGAPSVDASQVADGAGPDAGPDAGSSLSIAPAVQDFGFVVLGTRSANVTFTVSSAGATGPVTVAIAGSADFNMVSNGCAGGLSAGATCAVVVNYAPTVSGVRTAMLTASASPGGSAAAALTGLACSSAALFITPNLHDFGSVAVGQASAPVSFMVTSPACVPTGTPSVALSGAGASGAANFTLVSNGCTAPLAAMGGSCAMSVAFAPTTPGAKSATLNMFVTPGGTAVATVNGTATP